MWVAAALGGAGLAAAGEPQTVCTITVNSADEKASFQRHLPPSRYHFVELVERGRSDWLDSACRARIACDVLVISGHYDGGHEFFSDQLDVREYLPVAELERVSCSEACPGLFGRLKEVYLFGCNTLNPQPQSSASAEIVHSLVREGHSRKEAERQLRALNAELGESSRDRMRHIFKDVPVIYGFSAVAPLGPIAAAALDRHFRVAGAREVGQGHPSGRLLAQFAPYGLSVAAGLTDQDPQAEVRRDMCRFADGRLSDAEKLDFIHTLLQRHSTETRMFLDRIQRFTATLDPATRRSPAVAQALGAIARNDAARARFLDFARHAAQPEARVRMLQLARELGWLSSTELRQELRRMLDELLARGSVGAAEVGLACSLNQDDSLSDTLAPEAAGQPAQAPSSDSPSDEVPHAAVRACLGSPAGRSRTLQALLSPHEAEVQVAQAYLRHRPITDAAELRQLARGIVGMGPSEAQVRALEALGRHYVADRDILEPLVRLLLQTRSAPVQAAIAGILIRADLRTIDSAALARQVRAERHMLLLGDTLADALIQRLEQRPEQRVEQRVEQH
ncbi:MAG: hypothetical protein HY855_21820 [Burkholderiales bacterium]|nr:hypothetical protein [Burkholderiales bacterium]